MVRKMCVTLLVIVALSSLVSAAKLPPSFKTCPRSKTANFIPCLTKNIEAAFRDLRKGYAPLGIYPVDPLHITAIDIDQGTGPVSIKLNFRELDIKGLSGVKIKDLKVDVDNMTLSVKVAVPNKILLDGLYTIDGKVLILPIKGEGVSNLILEDLTADILLTGKELKKDGQIYMRATKFDFILDVKNLVINLTNLFNGDKALGDNMNKFLNENSLDILKELKPAVQETFGLAFLEITNRIFTKVPYAEIFPMN